MNRIRGNNKEKNNNKSKITSAIKVVFILLILISIVAISIWCINGERNKDLNEKISNHITVEKIKEESKTEYNVDFKSLKEINSDTIGWIKVSGIDLENVVVKARDNNFYLNHDFNKKYNGAGSIFADYKNKFDGTDKNIILYGHNRKDGSMFGTLKNILNKEWYENKDNYIIDFITENEKQKYQVFSIYQIQTEDYYIDTEFKYGEFEKFVTTLKNRSKFNFGIEVSGEDSILTLSTCANNYRDRIVLHAKRISN